MKHLENFKSEYIQSIYDFLEKDADVTNFKRDLIAIAAYKKISLHDLDAELYQYAELMKEDLKDKIIFVFREDGYLGMFGYEQGSVSVQTLEEYSMLKTGDNVSLFINYRGVARGLDIPAARFESLDKPVFTQGVIWEDSDKWIYVIQNIVYTSKPSGNEGWKEHGDYCLAIGSWHNFDSYDPSDFKFKSRNDERYYGLRKSTHFIPNLISDESGVKELKDNMHFALVI